MKKVTFRFLTSAGMILALAGWFSRADESSSELRLTHYTAAGAYQRLNRTPEMSVELNAFLQQDPNNAKADPSARPLRSCRASPTE